MIRRPVLLVTALVVVLLAVVGLLAFQALRARAALEDARDDVALARAALAEGDAEAAAGHIEAARGAVDRSRASTRGPHWSVASALPLVGRTPRTLRAVVDVADAAVSLAEGALQHADDLLGDEGGLPLRIVDGRVDIEGLASTGAALGSLPIDELAAARDRLASIPTRYVPAAVATGRRQVVELADETLATVGAAVDAVEVIPAFLGAGGARDYLLVMQNNAELRGTGGLPGLLTVLTIDDGRFRLAPTSVYDELEAQLDDVALGPVEATDEFLDRYGAVDAASFLNNANVDPDLPTSAPVILELWERRGGGELDGIIALDPVGLATILDAIGPVALPAEVIPDGADLPNPVEPDDLPEVVMVDAYDELGGSTDERRAFLSALAASAFADIISGDWDPIAVARAIGAAATERHLQVFSQEPGEQATFERLGVGGALDVPPDEPGTDLLAVTANNAAANKQDIHVGHAITWEIRLGAGPADDDPHRVALRRDATVEVGLVNDLATTGHHEWIVGSARPGTAWLEGLTGERGLNRTWWTIWMPETSSPYDGRDAAGNPIEVNQGVIHGHLAVDEFVETPSGSSSAFDLSLRGPAEGRWDGRFLTYRLRLWHQAKGIPDDLDVTIAPPDGWRVVEVETVGGGSGRRLDVSADAVPGIDALDHRIRDGAAVVRGEVTADLTIEVAMRPS